ncbi:TRAP transporter substrate-binding protein [Ramlibacter tataouinensis]|uniref:Candidate periplasmic component n=1 Tax=Ramlibacter tataouinensis (strain ATCC BAA-407 / DSM 14655 / LMG 21543 / TTB310) TaxID=365046 RepID=F5Y5Z0_RAMTT|nr:TRAP transporter substrate-binding protein [Ramlibacter tataouinensis]AEG91494.1 Candidate periplasmic component [Ramlibacter tataouinensis TTB310]
MRARLPSCLRLAAAAVLAACAAGAFAQDKPVELKFAHWLPANHSLARNGFEPWAKSVEAASKGSIKVVFFPSQQLGKAADHYDMARDGIADVTWANPGYQAGRFPLIAAGELPFLVAKPGPGSAALDAWYRRYAGTEMKDVKFCFAHLHVGTLHAKKPITEPGQLKGMKIRSSNGTNAQFMTLLGATNVQVSAPEARDALEKGVADAISFPWGSILSFGIDKAVKYHTDMRLYASDFAWVVNKGWYDKLGASQKKVIDDHCSNEWAAKVGAAWGDDEDSGQAKLEKAAGHTIVKLTPAQLDAWKKAAEPLYGQWVQGVDKAGANGKQALAELRKELDARKAGN